MLQKYVSSGLLQRVWDINPRVKFPSHLSFQNLTFCPLPRWNWPRLRKKILNFHQATPNMRIPLFSLYLCYGTIPHARSPQEILPHPFLINQLKQLFTKQPMILNVYILNTQTSLAFWLAYNSPFCQPEFLFVVVTLPVESRSIEVNFFKNPS
jgi:hypothetical protein